MLDRRTPPTAPRSCDQACGNIATVYAMDRHAGGWGGWYCVPCAHGLRFVVTDHIDPRLFECGEDCNWCHQHPMEGHPQ